jgi:hypothetical protein
MDPISTVGAGLAVIGSKDILVKILGPTADYVGGEVKNFVAKCNVNLDNIFIRAQKKLGDRISEDGQVSPRVLKHVIDEGRFCEDSIVADYYGGVLASSKSEIERDDRGVAVLATIKSLSVYQLRLHYLFYSLVYDMYKGKGKRLGTDRAQMSIYIPISVYLEAMSFSPSENVSAILIHSVEGLVRSGLVESNFSYGSQEYLSKRFPSATEPGIIMAPSVFGAEVFLWGQGVKGATGHEVVDEHLKLPPPEIAIPTGSQVLQG